MKKLNITWDGVYDSTGYLFSFAKSLSCAVNHSPYSELSEDIVATSGFAFRMWISADLCPSETSIWDFGKQPVWIANGGLNATLNSCLWQSDEVMAQAQNDAMPVIKKSIDSGVPVVSWDVGECEWGLIIGYDDEKELFYTLLASGSETELSYENLGKRDMPMLDIITITDKSDKSQEDIIADTLMLAKSHLSGEEWCENAQGLAAYTRLIEMLESEDTTLATSWGMEYALGTFGALKWYAWKFFEKYDLSELALLYKTVYECWQKAFEMKKTVDLAQADNRKAVANLLKQALECEQKAIMLM